MATKHRAKKSSVRGMTGMAVEVNVLDAPARLAAMPELQSHWPKLESLGYVTVEDFVGAAQAAGPELKRYLGVEDLDTVISTMQTLPAAISAADQELIDENPCQLGALVDEIPRVPFALASEPLKDATDGCANWVHEMPPVKNQQSRGTCVAFATTAVYEHYLLNVAASLSPGQSMSEQFLYWDCKRTDGHPNLPGTWVGKAFPALQNDGQCLDVTWPYNPIPIPGNEGQGPQPPKATVEALRYRIPSFTTLAPTSVPDIRAKLAQRRCVAFSVPVFNSWYANNYVKLSGDIVMPIPGEIRVGGHAMCIVGCIELPGNEALGNGRFILRNSWGASWGIQSSYGAGYGTIPFAYISKYCMEAYSLL